MWTSWSTEHSHALYVSFILEAQKAQNSNFLQASRYAVAKLNNKHKTELMEREDDMVFVFFKSSPGNKYEWYNVTLEIEIYTSSESWINKICSCNMIFA